MVAPDVESATLGKLGTSKPRESKKDKTAWNKEKTKRKRVKREPGKTNGH